ncbi:MAG: hypothetical protein A2W05_03160 [Candidatus Schekmanbacteria bacterium RBG_16_38_10]|uniref:Uncharacterized protein n=1 Tax=Candidatus Schekmanbacteria bacterium RBG_16_38_10 TaxID=1817879 RepID=A0A1F7RMQ5_9BACT|nr:MAG: hypothetical protein A2W05_03160 [Candidatus Schekmanbacteria bacterium RBG_16_38_10]
MPFVNICIRIYSWLNEKHNPPGSNVARLENKQRLCPVGVDVIVMSFFPIVICRCIGCLKAKELTKQLRFRRAVFIELNAIDVSNLSEKINWNMFDSIFSENRGITIKRIKVIPPIHTTVAIECSQ